LLKLWLIFFAVTFTLETPVYILALRRVTGSIFKGALASLVVNLSTHPVVWFVLPKLFTDDQVKYTLTAEGFAVSVEALILIVACRVLGWEHRPWLWMLGLAFLANATSVAGGMIGFEVLERLGVSLGG
jgi:hypothetical protein